MTYKIPKTEISYKCGDYKQPPKKVKTQLKACQLTLCTLAPFSIFTTKQSG